MKEEIKNILSEIRPEFDFDDSDNYIEDGMLDLFDIVTLVSMIEEKYDISIDGLDIVPENFVSVEAIVELINKSGAK